jgi:hypothetical protein
MKTDETISSDIRTQINSIRRHFICNISEMFRAARWIAKILAARICFRSAEVTACQDPISHANGSPIAEDVKKQKPSSRRCPNALPPADAKTTAPYREMNAACIRNITKTDLAVAKAHAIAITPRAQRITVAQVFR